MPVYQRLVTVVSDLSRALRTRSGSQVERIKRTSLMMILTDTSLSL